MYLNTAVKARYILTWVKKTIKENGNFEFYYNKTDIIPIVLDGGNEIILANLPNNNDIRCNINNDIPIRIPSHPQYL